MQNVSILILCCAVEKGAVCFFRVLFIFFKNKTFLDNSWQTLVLMGSAGTALCCATLLQHEVSCLWCAASHIAEDNGRWQEVDLCFGTPLHSDEWTSSYTESCFPCAHREITTVTFSGRWCCTLLLLTEWDHLHSADRRCSLRLLDIGWLCTSGADDCLGETALYLTPPFFCMWLN